MPSITPLTADFSVGEIAPDMQMRSTLDARNRGAKSMRNFIPDPRGPVRRRDGFRFLGKVGLPGTGEVVCGDSQTFSSGSAQAKSENASLSIYKDALDQDVIILTKRGQGGSNFSRTFSYDIETDTWTERLAFISSGNLPQKHITGSPEGFIGQNNKLYVTYNSSGPTWDLYRYSLPAWSQDWSASRSSNIGDMTLFGEGPTRLLMRYSSGWATTRLKDNFGGDRLISVPSGYDDTEFVGAWSPAANKWVMINANAGRDTGGISLVDEDFDGTLPTPPQTLSFPTAISDLDLSVDHAVDSAGNCYFVISSRDLADHFGYPADVYYSDFVVKVTSTGAHVATWGADVTGITEGIQASSNTGSAGALFYDASTDRVFISRNGRVSQYDVATDTWTWCDISGVQSSLMTVRDSDGYLWSAVVQQEPALVRNEIF